MINKIIDKIVNWSYNHPNASIVFLSFFSLAVASIITWPILFGIKSYTQLYQMEQAKTADFVMYTNDGKMLGMEHEVIVDMDTGYQYLVFNIHGDYVIAPRVSEDGTFYKTIE